MTKPEVGSSIKWCRMRYGQRWRKITRPRSLACTNKEPGQGGSMLNSEGSHGQSCGEPNLSASSFSVYDVLPSPANLHCWGFADPPACQLWQKRGTLEHILSCCLKAFGDGQYRWRHDQVVRALADTIGTAIHNSK